MEINPNKPVYGSGENLPDLQDILDQAQEWLQSTPSTDPAHDLAQNLVREIQSGAVGPLGSSPYQLQRWIQQTFTMNNDIYMQYPGLSVSDTETFYNMCFPPNPYGPPPPATPMPTLTDIAQAKACIMFASSTGPDKNLAEALMTEISSLGSDPEDPNALKSWAQTIQNSHFAGFGPLSTGAISEFETITGLNS